MLPSLSFEENDTSFLGKPAMRSFYSYDSASWNVYIFEKLVQPRWTPESGPSLQQPSFLRRFVLHFVRPVRRSSNWFSNFLFCPTQDLKTFESRSKFSPREMSMRRKSPKNRPKKSLRSRKSENWKGLFDCREDWTPPMNVNDKKMGD